MEYSKKYTVYKHIFPNDKIYIGITCNSPKTRWGNQGYGYKNQLVGRAIKKYGWNNIKHIIIMNGLTKEEAQIAERKLIKKYKNNNLDYGYNRTAGGDSRCCGYKLSEEEKQKRANCEHSESLKKDIDCYDLKGHFIKTFHGYREATKETTVPKSNIIQSAQRRIGRAKEFMFRFHEDTHGKNIEPYIQPIYCKGKAVNQYSLEGKYLNTFKNQSEAERQTGVKCSGISSCCVGVCETSGGYIWTFYQGNIEDILPRINKKAPKIVIQYSLDGKVLAMFDSIKEASRQTGVNYDVIRHYLDGRRKSGGGFIWETVEVNHE